MSMTEEAAAHRASVAAFVAAAEQVPEAMWETPTAEGKWSPAQVAEHLRLTYDIVRAELDGSRQLRQRTPLWMQPILRLVFLRQILGTGRIRAGVRAPGELRPGPGPFPRAALLAALQARATQAEAGLMAQPGARLTHHVFGRIGAEKALRFLAVHNTHHQQQLSPRGVPGA